MRIKVNKSNPNEKNDMAELQVWVESHRDGQSDIFVAAAPHQEALVFQFVYDWILGCHRFFMYDPINDELLNFYAEDFTDIGRYVFGRCDKFFRGDYEIIA